MIRLSYYPGCTIQTTAQNFAVSGLSVAKRLGVDLIELQKWNCCGVFPSLAEDDLMLHLAPIRVLIQVQELTLREQIANRVVTFCSMCYHTLKKASLFASDKEKLEKINQFLEREIEISGGVKGGYKGKTEVLDFLEVLRDIIGYKKIAQAVKVPLAELNVATYYGCLVLRPQEIAIDNPENPTILEKVLESIGANVVENPNRTQCCGNYHTVDRKEIVTRLAYDNLQYPILNGADVIVTCCPLCAFNLDFRQNEVKKTHKDFKTIPVVYYPQLMAVAFGLEKETYGFDTTYHFVDPEPIINPLLGIK